MPTDNRIVNATSRLLTGWARMPGPLRWGLWIGGAFLLLLARWPQALLRPSFYFEDGQTFFVGTYFGSPLEVIFRPYSGYFHLVPRLAAYLERAVPVASAPFVAAFIALLITAGVAAYIASDRMSSVVPSKALRWILAIALLLLPTVVIGTIHNVQWYMAIFLLCASLARPAGSRLAAWAERLALLATALTGLFSILFAPLFIIRARRERTRSSQWAALCVTVPAAMQLAAVLVSSRRPQFGGYTFSDLLGIISTRIVVEPISGANWLTRLKASHLPLPILAAGVLVLILIIAAAASRLPHRYVLTMAYGGGSVAFLGLISSQIQISSMLNAGEGQRYFFILSAMIAAVLIGGAATSKPGRLTRAASMVGVGLLVIGVASDFWIPQPRSTDWATDSACIGGETSCVVPLPDQVPTLPNPSGWFIHWPGARGVYDQNPS